MAAAPATPPGCAAARSRSAAIETRAVSSNGEGVPTVLLHGWLDNADTWLAVLDRLSVAGRPAIAYDLPGFGTAPPLDAGSVLDQLVDFAAEAVELAAERSGGKVVVAGNSLGGWVALRLAAGPGPAARRGRARSARPGSGWRRPSSHSTASRRCRGSSGCPRRCHRRWCARSRAASTAGSPSPTRRRSTSAVVDRFTRFHVERPVIRERIEYAKRLRDELDEPFDADGDQGPGERHLGRGRPPLRAGGRRGARRGACRTRGSRCCPTSATRPRSRRPRSSSGRSASSPAEPLAEQRLGLVGDQPGERQRGGRRGGGRVADVERAARRARRGSRRPACRRARPPGRGPRPGRRTKSAGAQLRDEAPRLGDEARFDAAWRSLGQARRASSAATAARSRARRASRAGRRRAGARAGRRRGRRRSAPSARAAPSRRGRGSGERRGRAARGRAPGRCCARTRCGALGAQPQVGAAERDDARLRRGARRRGRGGRPRRRRRRRRPARCVVPVRVADDGAVASASTRHLAAGDHRPPARRRSSAYAAATRPKSTTPVARRVQRRRSRRRAARSRGCSAAPTRRSPATPLARPRRSSSSSAAELALARWRRSACRRGAPRSRARRSRRRARARPATQSRAFSEPGS